MKKLFLDSDVIFDYLSDRQPFSEHATRLINTAENETGLILFTSILAIANIHYLLSKMIGKKKSLETLKKFRAMISIAELDSKGFDSALLSKFDDFEDSLQHQAALGSKCHYIITRNLKDYKFSLIPVLDPETFLSMAINNFN